MCVYETVRGREEMVADELPEGFSSDLRGTGEAVGVATAKEKPLLVPFVESEEVDEEELVLGRGLRGEGGGVGGEAVITHDTGCPRA